MARKLSKSSSAFGEDEHRGQASADDALGWTEFASVVLMNRRGEVRFRFEFGVRSDVIQLVT